MKNCLFAFLAIVGSVIGSGFVSGKEIVVFFSRFGLISYPCILLSFFLFFFIIKMMLNVNESFFEKIKMSKFVFVINFFLCLIFSSAMFAGISNLLDFKAKIINYLIFFAVIICCYLVFKFGLKGLNKLNLFFVPFMIMIFFLVNAGNWNFSFPELSFQDSNLFGVFYSFLYVVLNTANSSFLIANIGKVLTKKQKTQVAFFSALALSGLLFIANTVLLLNPSSFVFAMPLVSINLSFAHLLMTFIVLIGCLTTLLTLVYTLSSSMRGLCKNEFLIFFSSIILPLILSLMGFDFIVEYLYPLASMLGIFLLFLFLKPSFKRTYKKIHSAGKHT